jgi:hypothetical protein
MSLKNSRTVLKSILARSVIFVSFAVTTGAGCALVPKNVPARTLYRNKHLIFFHDISLILYIRFELFEFFFKYGLLFFKGDGGLFKFPKEVVDG